MEKNANLEKSSSESNSKDQKDNDENPPELEEVAKSSDLKKFEVTAQEFLDSGVDIDLIYGNIGSIHIEGAGYSIGESTKNGLHIGWYKNGKIRVKYFYKNGKKCGPYRAYWDNGSLSKKCFYIEGKCHGEYLTFFKGPNDGVGPLCKNVTFKKGMKVGIHTRYNRDQSIYSQYTYVENKLHGPFQEQMELEGIRKGQFENDKRSHVIIENSKGVVLSQTYFKDGLRNGTCKYWRDDGTLKSISDYKDNELNGSHIKYYKNNSMKLNANYKDGFLDGKCIIYYEDGSLKETTYYKDGVQDGKTISYYKNGTPHVICNYKNGVFHGINKHYLESGTLFMLESWEDDKLHGPSEYYKDGFVEFLEYERGELKILKLMLKDNVIEFKGFPRSSILKNCESIKIL